jgi:hypothetical protein
MHALTCVLLSGTGLQAGMHRSDEPGVWVLMAAYSYAIMGELAFCARHREDVHTAASMRTAQCLCTTVTGLLKRSAVLAPVSASVPNSHVLLEVKLALV